MNSVRAIAANVISQVSNSSTKVGLSPARGRAVTYMTARPYAAESIGISGLRSLAALFMTIVFGKYGYLMIILLP